MKFFLVFLFAIFSFVHSQSFTNYFIDKTLRVDYHHTGAKGMEVIALDKCYEEGVWSGNKTQLLDNLNCGEYMLRVYDAATAQLIYSRGYSTMFNEWHSTDESN